MIWSFADRDEDAIYESSANHPLLENEILELQSTVPNGLWRTMSGQQIEISSMTEAHLRNAIAWAERMGYGGSEKLVELRMELEARITAVSR